MHRAILCLLLLPLLQGCIAWEIRDELRSVNSSLARVESQLADTNHLIDNVQDQLTQLEATNDKLAALQERLALLDSINASLANLDRHLASLRETIRSIDSAIPLLNFGSKDPEPPANAPPAPPPSTPPAPPPTPEFPRNR